MSIAAVDAYVRLFPERTLCCDCHNPDYLNIAPTQAYAIVLQGTLYVNRRCISTQTASVWCCGTYSSASVQCGSEDTDVLRVKSIFTSNTM